MGIKNNTSSAWHLRSAQEIATVPHLFRSPQRTEFLRSWPLQLDCALPEGILSAAVQCGRKPARLAGAEGGGPGRPGPKGRSSNSRGEGQTRRTPPPGSDATGWAGPKQGPPERGARSMAEAEGSSPLLLPPLPPPPGMSEVEAPTAAETDKKQFNSSGGVAMDVERSRFPYCVVWTPIPVLT